MFVEQMRETGSKGNFMTAGLEQKFINICISFWETIARMANLHLDFWIRRYRLGVMKWLKIGPDIQNMEHSTSRELLVSNS